MRGFNDTTSIVCCSARPLRRLQAVLVQAARLLPPSGRIRARLARPDGGGSDGDGPDVAALTATRRDNLTLGRTGSGAGT